MVNPTERQKLILNSEAERYVKNLYLKIKTPEEYGEFLTEYEREVLYIKENPDGTYNKNLETLAAIIKNGLDEYEKTKRNP